MRSNILSVAVLIVLFVSRSAYCDSISLYDASLNSDEPHMQSELLSESSSDPAGTATHHIQGSDFFTRIDTSNSKSENIYYSMRNQYLTLDRLQGFELRFRIRILSEVPESWDHRGPFSIMINSSDKLGVNLYFNTYEIHSQKLSVDTGTVKDQVYSIDATKFTDYVLALQGTSFTLTADGLQILSGSLIDFTNIYTKYPYVGFGDTSYASSGITDISYMSLNGEGVILDIPAPASIPEPFSIGLLLSALVCLGLRKTIAG